MTGTAGKRVLPPHPHLDYLRKEAKARLADMRKRVPSARLADVQFALAREYGFANWTALQAEVARRTGGPHGAWTFVRRAHVAALDPDRFRSGGLPDQETDIEIQAAFFRAGVITQIGFVFVALAGVSLLFLTPGQIRTAHAVLEQLAQLAHNNL